MDQGFCEHGEASEIDWIGKGRKAGRAESADPGKNKRKAIKRKKRAEEVSGDGVCPEVMIRS